MENEPEDQKRGPRNRPQVGVTLPYDVYQRLSRERNRSQTVELALRLYYNLPPEGFERFREA